MAEGKSLSQWVGEEIGRLDERVDSQSTPQLDGATVDRMYLSDGAGGIAGVVSGTNGVMVRDRSQPTPTPPVLEELNPVGVAEIRWDGRTMPTMPGFMTFPGSETRPTPSEGPPAPKGAGFGRVQTVHRLVEGGIDPDPEGPGAREGGAIGSYSGGTTSVSLAQPGTHAIWFYMIGPNNVERSAYSRPLIVEVEPLVDREEIQEWIDEKAEELEEYVHDFGNREGTGVPSESAPEGVVYYQRNAEGQVVGIWQSQGNGDWTGLPLNSEVLASVTTDKLVAGESLIDGVLIRDGSITLEQITVDGELVAEIAKIITVEADNIAANAIDGMTITGATLIGGRIATSQSGRRVELQDDAMTAYNSSNVVQARYSGDGIELRPPGGVLTPIGPHIFGTEVFTRATNQPWVTGTTIAEGSSSGWSTWLQNASSQLSFVIVSRAYVFDMSFMYIPGGGNMTEANASVLSDVQLAIVTEQSTRWTAIDRVFYTRGWWANTEYPLSYTAKVTIPSTFPNGTLVYPRFRFRSRAVNFGASVHSFIFKATPA